MKTIIHVNQHTIRDNNKGGNNPVISCRTYKGTEHSNEVIIYGQDGKEAARILYSKDKPLSCGARVWIETTNKVELL